MGKDVERDFISRRSVRIGIGRFRPSEVASLAEQNPIITV